MLVKNRGKFPWFKKWYIILKQLVLKQFYLVLWCFHVCCCIWGRRHPWTHKHSNSMKRYSIQDISEAMVESDLCTNFPKSMLIYWADIYYFKVAIIWWEFVYMDLYRNNYTFFLAYFVKYCFPHFHQGVTLTSLSLKCVPKKNLATSPSPLLSETSIYIPSTFINYSLYSSLL